MICRNTDFTSELQKNLVKMKYPNLTDDEREFARTEKGGDDGNIQ